MYVVRVSINCASVRVGMQARAYAKKQGPPETEDRIIIIIITICMLVTSESLKVGSFARSKEQMSHSLSRIEKASPVASPLGE